MNRFKKIFLIIVIVLLCCCALLFVQNRLTNKKIEQLSVDEHEAHKIELNKEYIIKDCLYVIGDGYTPSGDFLNVVLTLEDSNGNLSKKSIDNMNVTMDEYFVLLFTDLTESIKFDESTVVEFHYDELSRTLNADLRKK